jgi:two-component system NarL family sensor kinase
MATSRFEVGSASRSSCSWRSIGRALLLIASLLFVSRVDAQEPVVPIDSALAMSYNDMVQDLARSEGIFRHALSDAYRQDRSDAFGLLHRQLSTVLLLAGSIDSATYHGLLAAEHFRKSNDRVRLGTMLCDVGHIMKRYDHDQAVSYFREGIAILEAVNAEGELPRAYNNFAMAFEHSGARDSALHYAQKGLALVEASGDTTGLPYALNRVAFNLLPVGRFKEAHALILRADTIRRLINDVHGLSEQRLYFGDLYQAWGKAPEAIEWFTSAVHAARAVKVPLHELYAQERLAELYEQQRDAEGALTAMRRYFAIKDSLFSERNNRTILELEKRFEVAEKDRAIAELGVQSARRQLYIWLSLGALVLVVVVGLLFHQMRQRKARAERDAAIIAEREAGLKAVFVATEQERGRLARELHDGIGQQLGGLKHRLEALKETAPVSDVIGIVDDTSREVRDLAHQMMPRALVRLGLVPALEEMVRRTFHGSPIKVAFEHFGMDGKLPNDAATGLYRIAQELVTNVLKHAQATEVDIQLLRNKRHVVLMVQDNGVGFDPGRKGKGIGLQNIADRSRALGGSVDVESSRGNGTLTTVRIPTEEGET